MKFTKFCLALSLCLMVFGIQAQENPEVPTTTPDEVATFVGGQKAMMTYLIDHVRYPDSAKQEGISGKVYLRFVVEKDGSISSVEVLKGVNELLDAQAKKAIEEMPAWTPAVADGLKVRSYVTLPINFELAK
ncbi:protein TonB [Lishizhenia tianjinensis]|uniref:Protein TonB n=1 Tax=Lishizhenia tianjinensis TaxID=477690 RepID=A0A1I6X8N4_9FLAO|nr:energy transducer TonB [Lishizhenia tianjinensis]SFT34496.1 protein TonB [Lishizhenia tianjinensis]